MLIALGRRDHRAEAVALGLALRGANPEQVGRLVDGLLGLLDTPASAEALGMAARVFDRLDADRAKRLIASGMGSWGPAARAGLHDALPGERASIAALIGSACDAEACALLCDLIADADATVHEEAGRSLIALAQRVNTPPAVDALTRQSVEAAVAQAAGSFDTHRRKSALKAMLVLLGSPAALAVAGPELRALLADESHPAQMALRSVIKNDPDIRVQHGAWVWLGQRRQGAACIDRLARGGDAISRAKVFDAGHLLASPARRTALSRAATAGRGAGLAGLRVDESELHALSGPAAESALRIAVIGAPAGAAEIVEKALAHEDPAARAAGVRLLGEPEARRGRSATLPVDALLDSCFDEHAGVARGAMIRAWDAARAGRIDAQTASAVFERLRRSPHAAVRALAEYAGAPPIGAADGPVQRAVVRRWVLSDREGVLEAVRQRLQAGPLAERIGAVRLAQRLALIDELELDLLAILDRSVALAKRPPDAIVRHELRVAASAVSALGEARAASAQAALLGALGHADARVRANAVDALTRRSRRAGTLGSPEDGLTRRLIELKADASHRVCVGAARAELLGLKHTGQGAGLPRAIIARTAPLLADERPMHRVSGLWLAERLTADLGEAWSGFGAGQAMTAAVDQIAAQDPDGAVRLRAATTSARLRAVVRLGWSGRAATPASTTTGG
jgi:hypothetical protein